MGWTKAPRKEWRDLASAPLIIGHVLHDWNEMPQHGEPLAGPGEGFMDLRPSHS